MINAADLILKFKYALENNWGYIWGQAGAKWTAAKQEQIEKTTDADRELSRKYGKKWIGHYVADCSGLFVWAFKQLGGSIYHGSNTMYLRYCSAKGKLSGGKRDDGQELKPGTSVYVYDAKKDNCKHVGLYIGGGLVIEAKGTQAGVITSKITDSKWNRWGELKDVDYMNTSGPADIGTPADGFGFPVGSVWRPTIRRGDKGDTVKEAQTMLYNLGYDIGKKTGIDGDFGRMTESAVQCFQADHIGDFGLIVDGVVGPMTWDALDKVTAAPKQPDESVKTYTVKICGLDLTQAQAIARNYPASAVIEEGGDGQ
jgi:hypothetical protein